MICILTLRLFFFRRMLNASSRNIKLQAADEKNKAVTRTEDSLLLSSTSYARRSMFFFFWFLLFTIFLWVLIDAVLYNLGWCGSSRQSSRGVIVAPRMQPFPTASNTSLHVECFSSLFQSLLFSSRSCQHWLYISSSAVLHALIATWVCWECVCTGGFAGTTLYWQQATSRFLGKVVTCVLWPNASKSNSLWRDVAL